MWYLSSIVFSVLVSDGAGPVPVGASKNYSHPAINVYSAASCMTSGHGNFDASNLSLSNNSEEPLPLELHPTTPVPLQVSVPCSMVYPQFMLHELMYVMRIHTSCFYKYNICNTLNIGLACSYKT